MRINVLGDAECKMTRTIMEEVCQSNQNGEGKPYLVYGCGKHELELRLEKKRKGRGGR